MFTQEGILLEPGGHSSADIAYKELFQRVYYKKEQVWEMIAVRMKSGKSRSSPWAEQCEGKWKALTLSIRKCEDYNSKTGNDKRECPFYKELSKVYGY